MKIIGIFLLLISSQLYAADFEIKFRVQSPGTHFGGTPAHAVYHTAWNEALNKCPNGFEKKREWVSKENNKHFMHYSIKCFDNEVAHIKPSKP